jgi:hypothetical protein
MSLRLLLTLADDPGIGECTERELVDVAATIETTQHET